MCLLAFVLQSFNRARSRRAGWFGSFILGSTTRFKPGLGEVGLLCLVLGAGGGHAPPAAPGWGTWGPAASRASQGTAGSSAALLPRPPPGPDGLEIYSSEKLESFLLYGCFF